MIEQAPLFVSDRIRRLGPLALLAGVALTGIEAMAYLKHDAWSLIASRVWVVHGTACLVFTVVAVAGVLREDLRTKNLVVPLAIAWIAFLTFWRVGSFTNAQVNHEATQQVAEALRGAAQPDLRYTSSAFLGYPVRQYLLAAVPSMLMGRGLASLRLGYGAPFFLGVLVFYAGLRRHFRREDPRGFASGLSILLLTLFPYLVEYLRRFEQTILPVSFTLQTLGWLLLVLEGAHLSGLFGLVWAGSLLGTSYTPSLASWLLLCGVLIVLIVRAGQIGGATASVFWLAPTIPIVGFGLLSFVTREDLFKPGQDTIGIESGFEKLSEGFRVFFLGEPRSFVDPLLLLPVVVYLAMALVGRFGRLQFVLSWWAIGVVGVAVCLKGYAAPPPPFAIHRAIVVRPVLIFGLLRTALGRGTRWTGLLTLRASVLSAAVIGAFSLSDLFAVRESYRPRLVEHVLADLVQVAHERGAPLESISRVGIVSASPDLENAHDYLVYFCPNAVERRTWADVVSFSTDPGFDLAYLDQGHYDFAALGAGWVVQPLRFRLEDQRQVEVLRAFRDHRHRAGLVGIGNSGVGGPHANSRGGSTSASVPRRW